MNRGAGVAGQPRPVVAGLAPAQPAVALLQPVPTAAGRALAEQVALGRGGEVVAGQAEGPGRSQTPGQAARAAGDGARHRGAVVVAGAHRSERRQRATIATPGRHGADLAGCGGVGSRFGGVLAGSYDRARLGDEQGRRPGRRLRHERPGARPASDTCPTRTHSDTWVFIAVNVAMRLGQRMVADVETSLWGSRAWTCWRRPCAVNGFSMNPKSLSPVDSVSRRPSL
jgi:hypothetical protein